MYYQAIALAGTAESELRTSILAQCGRDCQPFPGRSDLGVLVNQVGFGNPGDPTELSFLTPAPKPPIVLPPLPPTPIIPGFTPTPPPTPTPPTPPQSETNSYGVTYIPSSPTNGFIRLAHCTEYRLENMTTGQVQYIARSNDYQLNLIEWNQGIRVTIEQRGICGS